VPEIASAAVLGERVLLPGPDGWIELIWPDSGAAGTVVAPDLSSTTTSAVGPIAASNTRTTDSGEPPPSLSPAGVDSIPWLTIAGGAVALLLAGLAATRIARGRHTVANQ